VLPIAVWSPVVLTAALDCGDQTSRNHAERNPANDCDHRQGETKACDISCLGLSSLEILEQNAGRLGRKTPRKLTKSV
jgi:hypothetical protein